MKAVALSPSLESLSASGQGVVLAYVDGVEIADIGFGFAKGVLHFGRAERRSIAGPSYWQLAAQLLADYGAYRARQAGSKEPPQ
jgi:hypothetical protein